MQTKQARRVQEDLRYTTSGLENNECETMQHEAIGRPSEIIYTIPTMNHAILASANSFEKLFILILIKKVLT